MSRPKAVPAFTGSLGNLCALAGDQMTGDALALVRERLALTPEKLALLILRSLNPDECIGQTEEAKLRGMKPDTLRAAKARGEFPLEINGTGNTSTGKTG